jgi:hypothetical protein
MRECDNSKIHISNNSLLSMSSNNVGHLITSTITTLQHIATLNHTSPKYTSLHLSTLHFLSLTLHYSPIWLNPSTFLIFLFHLPSLNWTKYRSHIPKLISRVMNPFTAQRTSLHFTSFYFICFLYFFSPILSTLHFTLLRYSHLQLPSLHFTFPFTFIALTSRTILHFPNPRFENMSFSVGSP